VLLKQDTGTPEDFQSGSTFSTNKLGSSTDEASEHVAGRKAPELRGVGETEHADLAGNVLSQVPHDQHSSTGDRFQKSSTPYCLLRLAPYMLPLFSRYYQVEHQGPKRSTGLGLGLYIAKEIVTHHGGQISVASSEGQGTTFTVRLPLAPDHEVSPPGEVEDGAVGLRGTGERNWG
jgi:hypothetical protein